MHEAANHEPGSPDYSSFSTPGPDRQRAEPPLQEDDIGGLGLLPGADRFDLELANAHPLKSPSELTVPANSHALNAPTFQVPDMTVPELQAGDPGGFPLIQQTTLSADPTLPDLDLPAQYAGLDVQAASTGSDQPALLADTPLPADLERGELVQDFPLSYEVQAIARPGELADQALELLRHDPTYQQLPTHVYDELWMAQQNNNQRRERDLGMLLLGLEGEDLSR